MSPTAVAVRPTDPMQAETAMTMPPAVETARPSPPAHLVRPCITTLRLDVSPSSGSAGTFDIRLGEGIDPNTVLEMWWPRSTELALRGRVRLLTRLRQLLERRSGAARRPN
jgi:hypothetical protein